MCWFSAEISILRNEILIYLTRHLAPLCKMLIDMLCQLHMASVLSSSACCVLCSSWYLSCHFQRSPATPLSPPHIKAFLISATLLATHPMTINLGLVQMRECACIYTLSFFFTPFLYLPCIHRSIYTWPHTHKHIEIPLVQMKAEVLSKEIFCQWIPCPNEVNLSLGMIFH